MSRAAATDMRRRHACRNRRGFSLVDILLAILLLIMGLGAVIALTLIGTREAQQAIGLATAQATARSALYDPSLVDPTKGLNDASVSGFLNGYFVKRTILQSAVGPGIDLVQVNVYWGDSGQELAGLVSLVRR